MLFDFLSVPPLLFRLVQIAVLCTVRGRAGHREVDPETCEILFLAIHSFMCRLCRPGKDIHTSLDSLVQEGNPVLEAFKKSRDTPVGTGRSEPALEQEGLEVVAVTVPAASACWP